MSLALPPMIILSRALLRFVAILGLAGAINSVHAEEVATSASVPAIDQPTRDKRIAPIVKELKLGEADETKVRTALEPFFTAMAAWHREVDPQLAALWSQWSEARGTAQPNEAKAAEFGQQIDAIYAGFRPKHDAMVKALGEVLSAAQIEAVKNAMTRSPGLERTYKAYLEIVPTLTEAQKSFIREKLLVAREQAMDTTTDKEKVNLFKKQKVQVQEYIQNQGYDWKTLYKAFASKAGEGGSKKVEKKNE